MKNLLNTNKTRILLSLLITLSLIFNFVQKPSHLDTDLFYYENLPRQNYIFKKLAYISGEITNPGIYEITEDTRISQLIEKAGGLTSSADLVKVSKDINLAKKLSDEEMIIIPKINSTSENNSRINLNTSTAKELEKLPGIGPVSAANLINIRPITSINDLTKIKGLSESKILEIKELISL